MLRACFVVPKEGQGECGHGMYGVLLSLLYVVDLALFVLVFLIVRSRRVRAERMVTVIGLSVIAYLVSLGLLIFVSSRL
jgi:hypothetical protein